MKIFRLLVLLVVFAANSASAKTLLVLGDSLSAAYNMQTEQGWVALLEDKLSNTHPDIQIVNASISGETTSGGLTRLQPLIDRHQPSYIVLELAANDGLRGTPTDLIHKNVDQLIEISKKSQAEVLLVGVRLPPNYGPRYTQRFFDIFENLSEAHNIIRVPFLMENVALEPHLMQQDRLHPNEEAQPIILENVLPYVEKLISNK